MKKEKNYCQKAISFYIKNFGCQMNVSDSEIVTSILLENGFILSKKIENSDIILFNSCSIREKSEITIKNQLNGLKYIKKKHKVIFGIIGCFTKKFRDFLLNNNHIDFFVNPNSYKEIISIIDQFKNGKKKIFFSKKKETYDSIIPYRKKNTKITSFLTITRGCNNMCTFCIVPITRGRETSSNPQSIIQECQRLYKLGYKEITLLGQNVDSYYYKSSNELFNFSELLDILARKIPFMRIRFSTSNPHDMSENVLKVISKYPNICNHIHLPVQSGSNKILKLMNRKYSREEYLLLIEKIKKIIPNCSISHDIMVGFCNEEEEDHQDTLSLMNRIKYNYGYMFCYSPRPNTYAYNKFIDNVSEKTKKRRLQEVINLQRKHSIFRMKEFLEKKEEVLIEGKSKKNSEHWYGRNSQNLVVVFPQKKILKKIGDIVFIKIKKVTSATLIGDIID